VQQIEGRDDIELAFVWNRTPQAMESSIKPDMVLKNLEDFAK
jgi:hypothetical protein